MFAPTILDIMFLAFFVDLSQFFKLDKRGRVGYNIKKSRGRKI